MSTSNSFPCTPSIASVNSSHHSHNIYLRLLNYPSPLELLSYHTAGQYNQHRYSCRHFDCDFLSTAVLSDPSPTHVLNDQRPFSDPAADAHSTLHLQNDIPRYNLPYYDHASLFFLLIMRRVSDPHPVLAYFSAHGPSSKLSYHLHKTLGRHSFYLCLLPYHPHERSAAE